MKKYWVSNIAGIISGGYYSLLMGIFHDFSVAKKTQKQVGEKSKIMTEIDVSFSP